MSGLRARFPWLLLGVPWDTDPSLEHRLGEVSDCDVLPTPMMAIDSGPYQYFLHCIHGKMEARKGGGHLPKDTQAGKKQEWDQRWTVCTRAQAPYAYAGLYPDAPLLSRLRDSDLRTQLCVSFRVARHCGMSALCTGWDQGVWECKESPLDARG